MASSDSGVGYVQMALHSSIPQGVDSVPITTDIDRLLDFSSTSVGTLYVHVTQLASSTLSHCVSLAAADFSWPQSNAVFATFPKLSPAVAALAVGRHLSIPVIQGKLVLGGGNEIFLVRFSSFSATTPPADSHVELLLTLRTIAPAAGDQALVTIAPLRASSSGRGGVGLIESDVSSAIDHRHPPSANGGLAELHALSPASWLSLNENWDSTVRSDMLAFLQHATGRSAALSCALMGRSIFVPFGGGRGGGRRRGGSAGLDRGTWQGVWWYSGGPTKSLASVTEHYAPLLLTAVGSASSSSGILWKGGFNVSTRAHSMTSLASHVSSFPLSGIASGLAHFSLLHTSATIVVTDADSRAGTMSEIRAAVPENMPYYRHTLEGPDDMPAHIKTAIFGPHVSIPIRNGRLVLPAGEDIFVAEFRANRGSRTVVVVIEGSRVTRLD